MMAAMRLVVFENALLSEAVAEMNRYSDVKIILADQALGPERVSGTFPAGEQGAFAESLTLLLPVEAEISDRKILLRLSGDTK